MESLLQKYYEYLLKLNIQNKNDELHFYNLYHLVINAYDIKKDNQFKKDLQFSNILIDKVNSINELYVNSITPRMYTSKNMTNVSNISNGANTNDSIKIATKSIDYYQKINNYDITKCYWNNMSFNRVNKSIISKNTSNSPGYASPIQKTMFMGAVGLIINDNKISITNWDTATNNISMIKSFNNSNDEIVKYVYSIDIKHALITQLMNNTNLINNWGFNEKQYLSAFIENVIFNIFDINNKNDIILGRLKTDEVLSSKNKLINYIYEDEKYEIVNNIKISFNDNIIELELPNDDYQYALKYIISK